MFIKICIFLAFVGLVVSEYDSIIEEEKAWIRYVAKFYKRYLNKNYESRCRDTFKQNYRKMIEFNKRGQSWKLGINNFTDQTSDEFEKSHLMTFATNLTDSENVGPLLVAKSVTTRAAQLPSSVDWRNADPPVVVTPVKNQGNCGSCWTFATTGALEGAYGVKYRQQLYLSEQQLLDCVTQAAGYRAYGCNGGYVDSALDYVRASGITTEYFYPYKEFQGSCLVNDSQFKIFINDQVAIHNEDDLLNAIAMIGPVAVLLNASGFQHYESGIYNDQSCSHNVNHAVLVVGYGSENGQYYWIVKNSWGPNWGENGYIRIAMGNNLCAIASWGSYPILN